MAPLRIAHLTATYPPYLGGAGTTASRLADGLADRGHHVEVFTAATVDGAAPVGSAVVHRLRPRLAIGNAPLLIELAGLRGFDVVHLHHPFIFGTELLHLARLRERAPLIVSYHNQLIGEGARAPLFAAWETSWGRLTVRTASRVCVVSDLHAQSVPALRRLARRRAEAVVEVPNGVDLDAFSPGPDTRRIRARHGIPADALVVAWVGTLDRAHYLKRPDLAIDAVAGARLERAHLVVAGGGEWLEPLRARAARAGIAAQTTFLGPVDHDLLPDVLRAADVLLLTSDLESFGIVLLEAMACGLPTVATACVGPRVVTDDGRTGRLAPVGDAAALAALLREMDAIGEPGRAAMGAAGRKVCEGRYGWPRIVDRIEAVYADIAA